MSLFSSMRNTAIVILLYVIGRLALLVPVSVAIGCGAGALSALVIRAVVLGRRAKRAVGTYTREAETWVDCDEVREVAGIRWKCSNRKGHEGVHEASPSVEW